MGYIFFTIRRRPSFYNTILHRYNNDIIVRIEPKKKGRLNITDMKVSIVTISYNQCEFLEQALVSVLDQDYHNIEYIVIDAGSTDGSREIIQKHHHRIDKVIFEEDEGPADGLNKGFSIASGHIYGFLNSDDFLLPGVISKVVDTFKKQPNGCYFGRHSID